MNIPSELPDRVAFHEAGHAVVFLARGHAVPFVTILSREEGQRPSWTQINPKVDDQGEPDDAGMAAGCVAGEIAELLAFGNAEDDGPGGDHDNLLAILDRCDDEHRRKQILCSAYELAEQILRQHWTGVQAIAAELSARKTMTGNEVKEALRLAGDGE